LERGPGKSRGGSVDGEINGMIDVILTWVHEERCIIESTEFVGEWTDDARV
jgi:hypothetical protein